MARYDVRFDYDRETNTVLASPTKLDFIQPGDKVVFSGGSVSGLNSGWWTNSGSLSDGGYTLMRHDFPDGSTDYVTVNVSGHTTQYRITRRQIDSSPDSFGLSTDTNVDPKALRVQTISLKGFNTDIWVRTSGMGSYFQVGYGNKPHLTSYKATTNVTILLYYFAPDDYGKSGSITFTAGSRTQTFSVQSRKYPLVDQKIAFPVKSGNISLRDVGEFFGWAGSAPNLSEYYRGGGLVPSIAENEHVPTTPPLRLTHLRNTYSALYFTIRPPNKSVGITTLGGSRTYSLGYNVLNDYTVGYGTLANDLEYRYEVTQDHRRASSEVKIHSGNNSPSTWGANNTWVRFDFYCPANSERDYFGTLTIYVRNRKDHSLVISQKVNWNVLFYSQ